MKRHWTGIILIVAGVLFLLDSMDIVAFHWIMRTFWPVALIAVGVSILIKGRRKQS